MIRLFALLLALLVALPASAEEPAYVDGRIARVSVKGTKRIEDATVLAAIGLRRGQTATAEKVRRDLKSVYGTGFFDDVRVYTEEVEDGIALTFEVVEKPAVREVRITGNKKIDEEDIREVIDIRAFAVLNDADVKLNTERIRDVYVEKGYFLVDVNPEVSYVTDDSVDLIFQIAENRKVIIADIDFHGNDHVPASKIKRFMQTKTGGIAPWLTSKGAFRRELLETDLQTVRYVFLEEGFVNVRVGRPKVYLSPDKRYIYISIKIDEGPRFNIGEVDVQGDFVDDEGLTHEAAVQVTQGRPVPEIQEEQWRRATGRPKEFLDIEGKGPRVKSGDVFKYSTLMAVTESLATFYKDQGYAFATVSPMPQPNESTAIVDILFQVDKGEKVRIGRINITGNDPTFDKVVRREILINEGDIYRGSLIQASKQRLQRLGYFEDIFVSTPKGEGDGVLDINLNVSEQPTGSFSLGLGYSNLESIVLTGNVSKNNFLGLGYTLSAAVNWSRLRRQWNVSLFDPYLFDTRWTLQINGYNITRQFQLDEYQRGGSLSVGRYLDRRDDIRISFDYTFEDVGLNNLAPAQQHVLGGEIYRNGITSTLGVGITVDKRNNRIMPFKGIYASSNLELSGGFRINDKKVLSVLGGDFNFWQFRLNFRMYQPLIGNNDTLVFRWNTTFAYIGSTDGRVIPFIHRYRAGGINSVRGYQWFSLGPAIRSPRSDDPIKSDDYLIIGGTASWINNFELVAPIVRGAGLSAVVFFDAGNAFGDPWGREPPDPSKLRFSYGAGIRWQSPMGPLRFEYGIPVKPREGEKKSVFDFSIGSFF